MLQISVEVRGLEALLAINTAVIKSPISPVKKGHLGKRGVWSGSGIRVIQELE
jgi:hypothetical protein